jgi:DNA-binding response OmpR family regulator
VLIVDDDRDLRETLAEVVAMFGGRAITVSSVAELEAVAPDAGALDLAILDVNLGPGVPSGVDAYRWLRTHRFTGRVLFLTGHARSHPLVSEVTRMDGVRVQAKPISFEELRKLLQ